MMLNWTLEDSEGIKNFMIINALWTASDLFVFVHNQVDLLFTKQIF